LWLPLLLLWTGIVLAYFPSLDNAFISWDDDYYLYDNPQINRGDGIISIWSDVFHYSDPRHQPSSEARVSHQYYPVLFTSYWLEFRFHSWLGDADPTETVAGNIRKGRMSAASFHTVNLILHLFNVALLIIVLRALGFSNWVVWVAVTLRWG